MTRREVAIRDFYDIDYGVTKLGLQSTDGEMVKLVRKKIAVPGNDPVDVSDPRISHFGASSRHDFDPYSATAISASSIWIERSALCSRWPSFLERLRKGEYPTRRFNWPQTSFSIDIGRNSVCNKRRSSFRNLPS